jgi:hypothetical protein
VFALSCTFRNKYYHHLLARQQVGEWQLDEKPLAGFQGTMEQVVAHLQTKRSSRLAGLLEKDPYGTPELDLESDDAAHSNVPPPMVASPTIAVIVTPSDSASVDDVATWLSSLGMVQYAPAVYKKKFNGAKLHKATESQLRKIIKSEDDYRLIARALK